MSIKVCRTKLFNRIRSELCRIDMKCVLIGAGVTLFIGFLSAIAGGSAMIYRVLTRPIGAPPAFLFPIIWTVIYLLIGGAVAAVVCVRDRVLCGDKFKGLFFFVIMMVFNFIWYPLFFRAGAFFAAFIAILIMIAATFLTLCAFSRIYLVSTAAMIIYLVWLIFAAYLNLGIIVLN